MVNNAKFVATKNVLDHLIFIIRTQLQKALIFQEATVESGKQFSKSWINAIYYAVIVMENFMTKKNWYPVVKSNHVLVGNQPRPLIRRLEKPSSHRAYEYTTIYHPLLQLIPDNNGAAQHFVVDPEVSSAYCQAY